ncbi:MAG TPA: LacI family DNA-binding transcriptional regulator [Terriglobales bacterium]|jgi:DNA-binding LacI/PurR family transcriptional regulator|nr:LacI family DNA-binding transcriptional regulator [Terriglobales bacterium]
MAKSKDGGKTPSKTNGKRPVRIPSLKELAEHLNLSPATVSLVMNRTKAASAIPEETQRRIFQAAKELNYRPNFYARSLRMQRSFTIGILHPDLSDYVALLTSGIEDYLMGEGYFYFAAGHRNNPELIEEYPLIMLDRAVEGIIAIDTPIMHSLPLPVVIVAGHRNIEGVTNVIIDHRRAAELALGHLIRMGHREIAFMKGPRVSSDSEVRWQSICEVARSLNLEMKPSLCVEMEFSTPFPDMGYPVVQKLLASGERFTALFAFNDVSAIGAIRALRDAGLEVPGSVAVVGFDDIPSAAYNTPSLTTIRQPLRRMGEIAARTLLDRLRRKGAAPKEVAVEPELVIRESTTTRLRPSAPLQQERIEASAASSD